MIDSLCRCKSQHFSNNFS